MCLTYEPEAGCSANALQARASGTQHPAHTDTVPRAAPQPHVIGTQGHEEDSQTLGTLS